jgi:iron complex transport system substrate-binding protein
VALLLGLHGLAAAAPLTHTDDLGRRVTLPAAPQRIVAIGPSLVESLCAVGGCDRLVGVDRFSNHPASVQRLPKLGGLGEVSLEQIVGLRPDLVLLTPASRLHDRLTQLGVPVLALDAQSLPEVERLLRHLATLVGEPARAERVWAQMQREIDEAAARLPAAWTGRTVYFEVDPTPFAAGEASYIGAVLARLGLRNIVPARLGTFPQLNPEFVLQAQPALIVVGQREAPNLAGRPGWARVPAVRDGRVCALPRDEGEVVGRPGPRVGEAARALVRCIAALPAP